MKKKLLSFIVAAVMALSMLPMGAIAAGVKNAIPEKRSDSTVKSPEAPVYRENGDIIYSYGFETSPEQDGWQFMDLDGNGVSWQLIQTADYVHSGEIAMFSGSYQPSAHAVDNRVISPLLSRFRKIPTEKI